MSENVLHSFWIFLPFVFFWTSCCSRAQMHWAAIADERERLNWDVSAVAVFWSYRSASKPGNANPVGPSKDSLCAQTRSHSDLGCFGGQRLQTAQQTFVLQQWKSVFTNLHIFNICIIPTIQLIPTAAIYNGMEALCSKAIFEEDFYGCISKIGDTGTSQSLTT